MVPVIRVNFVEEFQVLTFVRDGLLTGPVEPRSAAPASRSTARSSKDWIDQQPLFPVGIVQM